MRNQGVGAGRFDDHIKGSGAARPYDVGLDAAELVGGIAAFIHVVPDFTDRMKRREFVRTCIDEINPHTLARLRLKSVAAGHVGVILEDSPLKMMCANLRSNMACTSSGFSNSSDWIRTYSRSAFGQDFVLFGSTMMAPNIPRATCWIIGGAPQ